MAKTQIDNPKIVSRAEWLEARQRLLEREKALTRERDAVSAMRRELPWVRVEKEYLFDTPQGKKPLGGLFRGRSQLIVRHFMFGPGWKQGCPGCSFASDQIDGALVHLEQKDVAYVAVSRAPLAEIEGFRQRMGWHFPWVSSHGSDFNFDFHVSFTRAELDSGSVHYNYKTGPPAHASEELSGLSVFYRDAAGTVYHTYSQFARGDEGALPVYHYLDLTPKGREENGPTGTLGDWVKLHDSYGPVVQIK